MLESYDSMIPLRSNGNQALGLMPRGVTSTRNKRGCAILTKKVVPQNPGTYLKLRTKNPGTPNARLSVYMRKLATQIKVLDINSTFQLYLFYQGILLLNFLFVQSFKFSSTTQLSCDICSVFQNLHFTIVDNFHYAGIKSNE